MISEGMFLFFGEIQFSAEKSVSMRLTSQLRHVYELVSQSMDVKNKRSEPLFQRPGTENSTSAQLPLANRAHAGHIHIRWFSCRRRPS